MVIGKFCSEPYKTYRPQGLSEAASWLSGERDSSDMRALRFTEEQLRNYANRTGKVVVDDGRRMIIEPTPVKESKYRNKRTKVDGFTFASKKEAGRYQELRLLEKAGKITSLAIQERWPLTVNGIKVGTYVADFSYWDESDHSKGRVVEDCKGYKTPIYKLKKLLMFAIHGVKIRES